MPWRKLSSGVPQGCVRGATLCISDIVDLIMGYTSVKLCAADINIDMEINNSSQTTATELREGINSVVAWAHSWQLPNQPVCEGLM